MPGKPSLLRVTLVASLVAEIPGSAANLLANPGFATNLSGWTLFGAGTSGWVATDSQGDPNSGTLMILIDTFGSDCLEATQCVPVSPNTAYSMSGQALVARNSFNGVFTGYLGESPSALLGFVFRDAANCGGTSSAPSFGQPILDGSVANSWIAMHAGPAVSPSNAVSAIVVVRSCTDSINATQTEFSTFYDNLDFGPSPSVVEVPALGIAGAGVLILGLMAAASGHLRRHRRETS
jgi:hypothetical protein